MRLKDKVAIVTGGGSGIGLAYCRRFLEEGARVVVADIGREQGEAAESDLASLGDIAFVHTDIADEASAANCVSATLDRYERVDILINNAAIYGDYDPGNNSLDYLKTMYSVNVHGQWLMGREIAPHLVKQGWGRIVNVGSIAGYLHQLTAQMSGDKDNFELSSYSYQTSKFSVLGLTRHMAAQLGPHGVTVNCIAPGLVLTEATDKQVPEDFLPYFSTMSPMGRNAEAADLVGPAVFFASDDANLVNGQILVVDGGTVMPV